MKKGSFIILCLLMISCAKKEVATPAATTDPDYYPLKAGRFAVFEIDSTVYREIPADTVYYRYRIREVLAGSFTDDEGNEAWRLERYIKKYSPTLSYDSMPWQIKDVWQVNADHRKIQVTEENVRFTKLIFPLSENATWDGNAGNGSGEGMYRCTYKDRTENIGDQHFEKVAAVQQKDYRTLISLEQAAEKYARGVGLVYRQYTELYSNAIDPQTPVENRIEKGVVYTQSLIAHGYQ